MGKIKKLFLVREAKQLMKLVFDKGSFSIVGDSGISPDFSESEIVDLLSSINVPSSGQLVDKAKSLKTHQVEFEVDDKDVKKLKLK